MAIEIKGTIIKKLELVSGVGKNGKEWKKQSVVIERPNEKFNKEICVEAFGEEKIKDLNKFEVGDTITILANIFSREWNGKYFNSIQGYWFANKNAVSNTEVIAEDDNEDMPF